MLIVSASLASPSGGKLSTWVKPGSGGVMGDDATKALAWVKKHKGSIGSLSIFGMGPPGAANVTGLRFNAELKALGIDTYVLWGGHGCHFALRPQSRPQSMPP